MSSIIKVGCWESYKNIWKDWESFKKDDPKPMELKSLLLPVLIDKNCIVGKDSSKTFLFEYCNQIIGGVVVLEKLYKNICIGGIGKMAVNPLYRRNAVSEHLLDVCLAYMSVVGFDISILWASVLHVYNKKEFKAVGKTNMMYKYLNNWAPELSEVELLEIPKIIGAW